MGTEVEQKGGAGGDVHPRASRAGLFAEPWLLGASLCVVAAAACLVLGFYDAAFVTAALGAVAWFLNVRGKLPPTPADEDADEEDEVDEPEGDDAPPDTTP